MHKVVRLDDYQAGYLSQKARNEFTLQGLLHTKNSDNSKWQLKFFSLYQNLLFTFENENCSKICGIVLLEGCFCEKVIVSQVKNKDVHHDRLNCFAIYYRKEGVRQYELRAETETECNDWVKALSEASYSKVLEQKQQFDQKLRLQQEVLDNEVLLKWNYVKEIEELNSEIIMLKKEIKEYKIERTSNVVEESEELKKIKKVQSFFRGWMCRRRWKLIVDKYIRSEHAESMRKRNSIVFKLVESEEDYVGHLSTLVSVFLRPFRMSASSKTPPVSHDDVNSIFLNSETLLFLHQIFLKGLMARMENWPTIVLDLFDMLLPMLGIYQEYVRNHHYSLQVLAECKQKAPFNQMLQRCEEKPVCEGRSIATFLTYPMHQIPRYIITIHELIAHTPHDHVERKSLEFALSRLKEVSQIMQDEVSETENIRKNLAIERMVVEGCDILLDVNQTFVRQGSLIHLTNDRNKSTLSRLASFKDTKKGTVRQVYLFTHHLMLTNRASNGRLHLVKNYGKIPLSNCTLIEDPSSEGNCEDDCTSYDSTLSLASQITTQADHNNLDFRIIIDGKDEHPLIVNLVASTLQEKSAWCSDISQCIESLHYNKLLQYTIADSPSSTLPQSIRCDPKFFRDDVNIKFSRTLHSSKVPQIRHASVEKLLERLTDLRFLSIDFLNTFLITYRVFTTGPSIIEALRNVYRHPENSFVEAAAYNRHSLDQEDSADSNSPQSVEDSVKRSDGDEGKTEWDGEGKERGREKKREGGRERGMSTDCHRVSIVSNKSRKISLRSEGAKKEVKFQVLQSKVEEDDKAEEFLTHKSPKLAPIASFETLSGSIDLQSDDFAGASVTVTKEMVHSTSQVTFKNQPCIDTEFAESKDDFNLEGATTATDQGAPLQGRMSHLGVGCSGVSVVSPQESTSTLIASQHSSSDTGSAGPSKPPLDQPDIPLSNNLPSKAERKSSEAGNLSKDFKCNFDKASKIDDSIRNRLVGSNNKMLLLTPLYNSKSNHMRNNMKGRCLSNQNLHTLPTNTFPHHNTNQLDALSLSPTHFDPTKFKYFKGTPPSHFQWSDAASNALPPPLRIDVPKKSHFAELCDETFVKTLGGSKAVQSNEPPVINIRSSNHYDSSTSDESEMGAGKTDTHATNLSQKAASSILTLTKSLPFFNKNTPNPPSTSLFNQFKPATSKTPTHRASKTDSTLLTPLTFLPQQRHPRSASASTASGKPKRHSAKYESPSLKRDSMPNMSPPHPSPHLYHPFQRQSVGRNSSWGSFSCKSRIRKYSLFDQDQSGACSSSQRSSCVVNSEGIAAPIKAGIVVTSSRASKRRSSSSAAAAAFAAAVAGSGKYSSQSASELKQFLATKKRESVITSFATMRVLNVLRHWVTKYYEDFENDAALKKEVSEFVEEMMCNFNLLPVEYKTADVIFATLNKKVESGPEEVDVDLIPRLLSNEEFRSSEDFQELKAIDIAEQMTFLDHVIFVSIRVEELLGQTWMKPEKAGKAQHVLLVSKRFNEMSKLVVSEIISGKNIDDRVEVIGKWAAIADICKCFNNFNGVLQICAAFVNSSVYRLKRTWEKVPKQTKNALDKLQLLVSADGRFKNMRDALHRCDPPCIPYLGIYLTDLSFIEEGTPNFTEDKLVNFSKMRMIANVIQEIKSFQQTPYKIKFRKEVAAYLLDRSKLIDDEMTFKTSLEIEPRASRLSIPGGAL